MPKHPNPPTSKAEKANAASWPSFVGAFLLLIVAIGIFLYLMTEGPEDKPKPLAMMNHLSTAADKPVSPKASSSVVGVQTPQESSPATVKTGSPSQVEAHSLSPSGEASLNQVDEGDIHKAIEALDQGQVSEATQLLEGVIKRDPRNERALVEMAMMQLLDLKQPEQALTYLQMAFEVNPANPMVMNELVSLFEEQSKLPEGIEYFTRIAQKSSGNPAQADIAYGAGQMLIIAGKDQEAIPYLQKAVEGGSTSPRAWSDLAEAYSRLGDPEKSVDAYTKAITAQSAEMQQQIEKGIPAQYGVQRINYTKMQLAREYLKSGQVVKAQTLVDEVKVALPGDEAVAALQKQIQESKGTKS